jgi:hypothetical protein
MAPWAPRLAGAAVPRQDLNPKCATPRGRSTSRLGATSDSGVISLRMIGNDDAAASGFLTNV